MYLNSRDCHSIAEALRTVTDLRTVGGKRNATIAAEFDFYATRIERGEFESLELVAWPNRNPDISV